MSSEIEYEIGAADICERLVGIRPVDLQNFLARKLYRLRPSIKRGKVRSQRRLFSREDVYGIALVWLLFESGLRSDAIERILTEVGGTKKADANLAAKRLLRTESDYLVVITTPRKPSKSILHEPEQIWRMVSEGEMATYFEYPVEDLPGKNVLIIPLGNKIADVRRRLEILF